MSAAVWFWRQGSEQGGPITWEKLQALAAKGKIGPNDWVLREGWNNWRLACEASDAHAAERATLAENEVPPLPPPLPLPEPIHMAATVPAPAYPGLPAALEVLPPSLAAAPGAMLAPTMPSDAGAPPPLLPLLPPLAPAAPITDDGQPLASQDGVNAGHVQQLRSVLLNGTSDDDRPVERFDYAATAAMAAAAIGLVALPFETGLAAIALGGWCLKGPGDAPNGRTLAIAAVALGGVNVAFRVLVATVDLGLQL
jgi:hypothetical protein